MKQIFPRPSQASRTPLASTPLASWCAASPVTLVCSILLCLSALPACAQVQNRITQPISTNEFTPLKGSAHPLAQSRFDIGPFATGTRLTGVSLYFKLSDTQQANLQLLLEEQQNPASPNYHRWLTPAQFASQFGVSADDLAQVQTWLETQGLQVDEISPSRTRIIFSGTAGQIAAAFQTQLHQYQINGEVHFANATQLSIPAALQGMVVDVRGLSDFRPDPRNMRKPTVRYTSSSGSHYLVPADWTTIYDVNALYNAGYTGSGQTLVVVGQTAIQASDIANFRSAAGLPSNPPTMTLVPNTGTSVVNDSSGDEDESDLDVEWAGAMAKSATVNFVYVGNSSNSSVFDALQYSIEQNLAPVISISYGACEQANSLSSQLALQTSFEQANAQGQTIVAAAGDEGAADCEVASGSSKTVVNGDEATQGLAVDFPGSSPNVTTVGGTEFSEGTGTYWNGTNNSQGGSATAYIPEQVWNDTSPTVGLAAGGGGKSIIFGKPSWQTGTGVPSDGARDVPDIALAASPDHDGYLVCASGYNPATNTDSGDSSSCSNGFADAQGDLAVFGGTSFGAPTFSGVLTLINQQLASSRGNLNPLLYATAAASSTAFHDVATGNNQIPCESGSTDCGSSGVIGYTATTGYDLASGWGSIDAFNLGQSLATQVTASGSLIGTTTVLTGSTLSAQTSTSITFTATISADSGTSTPTGTVQFSVDGTTSGSPVTLSSGSATLANTFSAAGSHTVTATYSGDSTHSGSSSTLTLNVVAPSTGSFKLSATNVTVTAGSTGTSTVTVTPADGYTGTVDFTVTGPSNLTSTCFTATDATVSGSSPATATITINTSQANCTTTGLKPSAASGKQAKLADRNGPGDRPGLPRGLGGLGAAFASVFLLGFSRSRKKSSSLLLGVTFLAAMAWGIGCGGGSTALAKAPAGTYSITVTGTDSAKSSITGTTTFTLTVQ